MKYYKIVYKVINTKTEQELHVATSTLLTDEEFTKEKILLTWNNLMELYEKYKSFLGFEIRNKKKGRVIVFYDDLTSLFPIKEWKKEIDLTLKIDYKEIQCSIQEILNYPKCEKAIQYLNERGLTIKGA